MTLLRALRLRLAAATASAVAAASALVLVAVALWATAGTARAEVDLAPDLDDAVDAHEDVDAARDRLEDARAEAADLAERLQEAAARYEQARAHRVELEAEADEVADRVAAAEAAAEAADAAFAHTAAASYKRPGAGVEAGEAVLTSASRHEALHRAALVGRVVVGERRSAQQLASEADRLAEVRRQHETLQAGLAGAAADAEDAADELAAATRAAREQTERAAAELDATEQEVRDRLAAEREAERRRLAEERRRERMADRVTQTGGRGRTVLPDDQRLAGMACPVADPHSFIDSWHYPRSGGRVHLGVDIFADHGMPLYAVADGTVRRVWHNRLGGLSIDLIDDRGDRYYYAHLSGAHVSSGDTVAAGQHIADNGNSGNARHTPPHLHWQYHPGGGDAVNPYPLAATLCR